MDLLPKNYKKFIVLSSILASLVVTLAFNVVLYGLPTKADNPPSPTPTIAIGLYPSAAQVGSPDFTLTVIGSSFIPGYKVLWNGLERTTNVVSSTRITAKILAADIATQGTYYVVVYYYDPINNISNWGRETFTVNPLTTGTLVIGSSIWVNFAGTTPPNFGYAVTNAATNTTVWSTSLTNSTYNVFYPYNSRVYTSPSQTLSAGNSYRITETTPIGWYAESVRCSDGSINSSFGVSSTPNQVEFYLSAGQNIVCIFENRQNPSTPTISHLSITKFTNGGNIDTFYYSINGSSSYNVAVKTYSLVPGSTQTHSGSLGFFEVTPGTYSISETFIPGWSFDPDLSDCRNQNNISLGIKTNTGVFNNVVINPGDTISCTFHSTNISGGTF